MINDFHKGVLQALVVARFHSTKLKIVESLEIYKKGTESFFEFCDMSLNYS